MSVDDDIQQQDRIKSLSEEEFRSRLQLLVYRWIEREIPLWKPEISLKYSQNSQSLLVPIPECDLQSAGLVYFKSVFDPLWTADDLASLQQSACPWILLILSPCERFYEFDSALDELAARSNRIIVWRPAVPTHDELNRLHRLMQEGSFFGEDGTARGSQSNEGLDETWQLLASLYIGRGQFIQSAGRQEVLKEVQGAGLSRCLAVHLAALASLPVSAPPRQDAPSKPLLATENETLARNWAALLAGAPDFCDMELSAARAQILAWWEASPASKTVSCLEQSLLHFPDTFMTTRFSHELRAIRSSGIVVQRSMEHLKAGDISFAETLSQIAHHFAREESRLLVWRNSLANLSALTAWMPMLVHAQEYLRSAYPLGMPRLDELRQSLLDVLDEPHRFLEAGDRQRFDQNFLEFKRSYTECYCSAHEDTLNIASRSKPDDPVVDKAALRDLEMLAGLAHMDKSYLNRVRLIAKWVQRNQCDLPVRQILDRYPRCYCNFNPAHFRHMNGAASRLNGLVSEGIEFYRSVLRQCRPLIMEEISGLEANERDWPEVTSLLSQDPLTHMSPQIVEILNRTIQKHTREFDAAARKCRNQSSKL